MVWVTVVYAYDVQTLLASFAVKSDEIFRVQFKSVVGTLGVEVSGAMSLDAFAGVAGNAANDYTAAFVRVSLNGVVLNVGPNGGRYGQHVSGSNSISNEVKNGGRR